MGERMLLQKFRDKSLTKKDVEKWIRNQSESERLTTDEEVSHVADCMMSIFNWYHKDWLPGHFIWACLTNDFSMACGRADDTNSKVLSLYAKFLYNVVPDDYKKIRNLLGTTT